MATPTDSVNGLKEFSFARSSGLSARNRELLDKAMRSFAGGVTRQFSAYLGIAFGAEFREVLQEPLEEYRNAPPMRGFPLFFTIPDTELEAKLEFDATITAAILEVLLGGLPDAVAELQRVLTPLEFRLVESVHPLAERSLNAATEPLGGLQFSCRPSPAGNVFNAALPPREMVAVALFDAQVQSQKGQIRFSFPNAALQSVRQEIGDAPLTAPKKRDPVQESRLLARIAPGSVRADAVLSGATMSMRDLVDLEPGDVINLDVSLERTLRLHLNGVPVFKGFVVPTSDKHAFCLTGTEGAGDDV